MFKLFNRKKPKNAILPFQIDNRFVAFSYVISKYDPPLQHFVDTMYETSSISNLCNNTLSAMGKETAKNELAKLITLYVAAQKGDVDANLSEVFADKGTLCTMFEAVVTDYMRENSGKLKRA